MRLLVRTGGKHDSTGANVARWRRKVEAAVVAWVYGGLLIEFRKFEHWTVHQQQRHGHLRSKVTQAIQPLSPLDEGGCGERQHCFSGKVRTVGYARSATWVFGSDFSCHPSMSRIRSPLLGEQRRSDSMWC